MDLTQLDFVSARDHMVDSQLRPNRIVDTRLIRAARSLPRERFLPPELADIAYVDEDIRLTGGRSMMEPLVLAHLIQLAKIRQSERVLVIGAGAGYGAALIDAMGAQVTALEDEPALLERARRVLPEVAPGVVVVEGKLTEGQPGPWDVILIEGAVPEIPVSIGAQLNPQGGRLVTVIAAPPALSRGVLAEPVNPGAPTPMLRAQPFFDCATPLLPAFRAKPSFKF